MRDILVVVGSVTRKPLQSVRADLLRAGRHRLTSLRLDEEEWPLHIDAFTCIFEPEAAALPTDLVIKVGNHLTCPVDEAKQVWRESDYDYSRFCYLIHVHLLRKLTTGHPGEPHNIVAVVMNQQHWDPLPNDGDPEQALDEIQGFTPLHYIVHPNGHPELI